MKTLREIYADLFIEVYQKRSMHNADSEDQANRKANIYAVENTVSVWKKQFEKN